LQILSGYYKLINNILSNLDEELNKFIAQTGKSKVAVIIPLYGYWKEIEKNPLNIQTLRLSMDKIVSSIHGVYVFFVGESTRLPNGIQNYIVVQSRTGGNFHGVEMPNNSCYADYVRKGLQVAQEITDAAYFINFNPWNIIQRIGIDVMVDRLNYGDKVKIVSGFDLKPEVTAETFDPAQFENKLFTPAIERYKIDSNFMGITRQFLEVVNPDPHIRTAKYMEFDMMQTLLGKGFMCVESQRLPMFVFDVNIEMLENNADLESDKQYFIKKWGFNPV
jgi:hypothetical protein